MLSMTKTEVAGAVMVTHDMLDFYRMLESLGLQVDLPMIIEMVNSGDFNIAKCWSAGKRTHHVDVCNYFLCELKDQGLLVIWPIAGESNDADIFTKNVTSATFSHYTWDTTSTLVAEV